MARWTKKKSPKRKALEAWAKANKVSHRSGLEIEVQKDLLESNLEYEYEPIKIDFIRPASKHTYCPDLRLPNGILVEIKGEFDAAMRKKHLNIRNSNPELDIRFVFANPNNKLTKRKNSSTYAEWCDKNKFKWAAKTVPKEWFYE